MNKYAVFMQFFMGASMADLKHKKFIEKLSILAERNDPINPDLYQKYDVKRGLRNANGTGVLVGLTRRANAL